MESLSSRSQRSDKALKYDFVYFTHTTRGDFVYNGDLKKVSKTY